MTMSSSKNKRKSQSHSHPELSFRKKRRVEAQDARVISAQTSGKAFEGGEIDVDAFVKARQFEITALQDAMQRSKKTLNTRAFQNVPRDLRRRTASHTPSRVPKRLRARALREMKLDNTPINKTKHRISSTRTRLRLQALKSSQKPGPALTEPKEDTPRPPTRIQNHSTKFGFRASRLKRNRLLKPPLPQAKFRKRQIHKTWLPTHLFHAKRAHMTPPKEPLWRMAIPLSPTAKSYRPTHRAAHSRGAVAWDVSYVSTIAVEGARSDILATLCKFGVGWTKSFNFTDRDSAQWIGGSRLWQGWLYKPDTSLKESIAPVEICWLAVSSLRQDKDLDTQGETQVLEGIGSKTMAAKRTIFVRIHPSAFLEFWELLLAECKAQKSRLTVTDLRFEIGSISLVGPSSTEALIAILHNSRATSSKSTDPSDVSELRRILSAIKDPASLPPNVIISMDVLDPRLRASTSQRLPTQPLADTQSVLETLSDWPLDKEPSKSKLFNTVHRNRACRLMPSQKSINRRKALSTPQVAPETLKTDPEVPVMLIASRNAPTGKRGWTLLLPWRYLRIFWYALMYYPLSTGKTVSFAGLNEERQLAFEAGKPWFPADFPGTKAGRDWEQVEEKKRRLDWEKRPKGKRVEWDSLNLGPGGKGEVGSGWSCDWAILQRIEAQEKQGETKHLRRIPFHLALAKLRKPSEGGFAESEVLVEVKLDMIAQGVPKACARIYRLPTNDVRSCAQWVSLLSSTHRKGKSRSGRSPKQNDVPSHIRQQQLAASLLEPNSKLHAAHEHHPHVPSEKDLIGFVTTGNFNLGEGKGVGIGSILLSKVLPAFQENTTSPRFSGMDAYLCIVREAGQSVGRLARWKLASTLD